MNRAIRITRCFFLSLPLCGLLAFTQISNAEEPKEPAAKEAAAAPAEFKRAIPSVRQGTPVVGGKVGLSVLAAGFFIVSGVMAALIFRSPKEKGSSPH